MLKKYVVPVLLSALFYLIVITLQVKEFKHRGLTSLDFLMRFSLASRSPCDFHTLRMGLSRSLISQQAHPGDPGTSVAWYRLSVHAFLTLLF